MQSDLWHWSCAALDWMGLEWCRVEGRTTKPVRARVSLRALNSSCCASRRSISALNNEWRSRSISATGSTAFGWKVCTDMAAPEFNRWVVENHQIEKRESNGTARACVGACAWAHTVEAVGTSEGEDGRGVGVAARRRSDRPRSSTQRGRRGRARGRARARGSASRRSTAHHQPRLQGRTMQHQRCGVGAGRRTQTTTERQNRTAGHLLDEKANERRERERHEAEGLELEARARR